MCKAISSLAFVAIIITTPVLACNEAAGTRVTEFINKSTLTLTEWAAVTCAPTKAKGGKCDILCVSTLRHSQSRREILTMLITASAGAGFVKEGVSNFNEVIFSERELLERYQSLFISASKAHRIHLDLKKSKDSQKPEALIAEVSREWKVRAIPKDRKK